MKTEGKYSKEDRLLSFFLFGFPVHMLAPTWWGGKIISGIGGQSSEGEAPLQVMRGDGVSAQQDQQGLGSRA